MTAFGYASIDLPATFPATFVDQARQTLYRRQHREAAAWLDSACATTDPQTALNLLVSAQAHAEDMGVLAQSVPESVLAEQFAAAVVAVRAAMGL